MIPFYKLFKTSEAENKFLIEFYWRAFVCKLKKDFEVCFKAEKKF